MNQRSAAEIKRINALLDELGPGQAFVPESLEDAKLATGFEREWEERPRGPCGKQVYDSETACKAAIRTRLGITSNASKLLAYLCPTCHAWHMTSRKPDKYKKR